MLLFPFDPYFSVCLSITSVSILATCCSHSLWCCVISKTALRIYLGLSNQITVIVVHAVLGCVNCVSSSWYTRHWESWPYRKPRSTLRQNGRAC
jgi:hypothetical protein